MPRLRGGSGTSPRSDGGSHSRHDQLRRYLDAAARDHRDRLCVDRVGDSLALAEPGLTPATLTRLVLPRPAGVS